jgi:regulator of replication initiation timing
LDLLRYQTLEGDHQLVLATVAELERQLTSSERHRKKLKKTLASVVDTTAASERSASQSEHELKLLRSQNRKKDRALQALILQLNQTQQEVESTKRGASAMVAEATRIVEERSAGRRHHR